MNFPQNISNQVSYSMSNESTKPNVMSDKIFFQELPDLVTFVTNSRASYEIQYEVGRISTEFLYRGE